MDILEFMSSLSWPIVVGGALIYYRKTISALLEDLMLKKVKWGDKELELSVRSTREKIGNAERLLNITPTETRFVTYTLESLSHTPKALPAPAGNNPATETIESHAEISWSPYESPEAAVRTVGGQLRSALMYDMPFEDKDVHPNKSIWVGNAEALHLSEDEVKAVEAAITLYYDAAHGQAKGVTWDAAHRYMAIVSTLLERVAHMKAQYRDPRRASD